MERRRFLRFPVTLRAEAGSQGNTVSPGMIKDFSRTGLAAVFDDFNFNPGSQIEIKVQRPGTETFIPAAVEVRWKRLIEGKWAAGFMLKDFPREIKAEILECGFKKWLGENKEGVL